MRRSAALPAADGRHHYDLFGLRLASEVPLAELGPERLADRAADVVVRRGPFPPMAGELHDNFAVVDGAGILNVPGAARFLITGGREILVDQEAGGSERNMRLFLLGSAFGAILHQRGLLPLHANAIDLGGSAIAFLGHSGAGKSTMAAWFHDRGFNILADDVCVVAPGAEGAPEAHPGIPRLRLWREALEASGRVVDDHELSFDDMDKYNVRTDDARSVAQALPLGAVYLLERAEAGEPSAIARMSGADAVDALVSNTYRGAYIPMFGGAGRHLLACVDLARRVPIFRVRRRWGYGCFDEEMAALSAHARATIAGGA